MSRRKEKYLQISLFILTVIMIVLRFLLNEKGRITPDSIRLMRTAHVLPSIDNTITPLGYPLLIKTLTVFSLDEFWASKIIGILSYSFIIVFAYRKKFYFKEILITTALFSYVSIFSFTLTETLIIPFVFLFLYISRNIIIGKYNNSTSIIYLSLMLIALDNIRYSALFFMGACFLFGLLNRKKSYAKPFIFSAIIGFIFVILYKFTFIDYFNSAYVEQFLEIGLHPTSDLLVELFQGLTTTFNPFIHIANPAGGIMNIGIYGIGLFTILIIILLFYKNQLSETEKFLVFTGIIGILCSFFIQYFYSVDKLDYRLLTPFVLSIWLVFFKKLFSIFGNKVYLIGYLSLATGLAFSWLSRGDYLANRKAVTTYLEQENLLDKNINFYSDPNDINSEDIQVAELISSVNPRIYINTQAKDTLKTSVLTATKVKRKLKIINNQFQ